jgi:C_GCAxxG_C_C family probable redox protein
MESYDIENSKYAQKAMSLFKEGYNCSQAVFIAFEDVHGIDRETAAKISSSFGGGIGRMREVCGTVSGMAMVAGLLQGYADPTAKKEKSDHYALIQELAGEFKRINGSYICRELLAGVNADTSPNAEVRTAAYYKKRPCVELCGIAAAILEKKLNL